jgi:hypothetical protein
MAKQPVLSGTLDSDVLNEVLTIDRLQSRINDLQIHRTQEYEDTLHLLVRAVDLLTQLGGQLEERVALLEASTTASVQCEG